MLTLPSNINEVNPQWLTMALAEIWPDAAVSAVEVINIFDGTSSRIRLKITRNDAAIAAGIPEHLCLKANWTEHAEFTLGMGIWANEANFYRSLRPHIELRAPKSYYANFDTASGQGIILMEDLVAANARFGSNSEPLSVDQTAQVLDELATLHAHWWNSPSLDSMHQIPYLMGKGTIDAEGINYHGGAEGFAKLLAPAERAATMPANINDTYKMAAAIDALVIHEANNPDPRCIIHGDTHLGNSYYLPDGSMGWLDWQLVRRGRPMREISYFLGCALTIADRRASERYLLKHYLECLRRKAPEHGLGFERAWQEYCRWPIWGFTGWAVTGDNWQPVPVILETMRRIATQMDDLDTYSYINIA